MRKEIIEVLGIARNEQPDPPCEKYLCPRFNDCKTEKLACAAFAYYVTTNRVIPPWKRAVTDPITRKVTLENTPIAPTKKIYNKIFSEDE